MRYAATVLLAITVLCTPQSARAIAVGCGMHVEQASCEADPGCFWDGVFCQDLVVPCLPGTFSPTGVEPCLPCDPGSYAAWSGMLSCDPCDPGTYAPMPGMTSCDPCDSGFFADSPGRTSCSSCDPGTYAPHIGMTSCLSCDPGSYNPSSGMPECLPCDPGSYADSPGMTSCLPCPAGYVSGPGATECTLDCMDGDLDGYGDGTGGNPGCAGGTAVDCDDGDYWVNPGAAEICGDDLDNDCDCSPDGPCYGVEVICTGQPCCYGVDEVLYPSPPLDTITLNYFGPVRILDIMCQPLVGPYRVSVSYEQMGLPECTLPAGAEDECGLRLYKWCDNPADSCWPDTGGAPAWTDVTDRSDVWPGSAVPVGLDFANNTVTGVVDRCSFYAVAMKAPTSVIISSAPNPSGAGQPVTVSWTVTRLGVGPAPPSGTVTISDGQGNSCSGSAPTGNCALTPTTMGALTLTAVYPGDMYHLPGGGSAPHQVSRISTTTTVVGAPNPSAMGQPVTFTATVAPTSGAITPTGSVVFKDGTVTLGSRILSGGVATLVTSTLSGGAHTITAQYGGDSLCGPSGGSMVQTVTVTGARLIYPNGGELFQAGDLTTISWSPPAGAVKFQLAYSTDNGVAMRTIVTRTAGTSYPWTVPAPRGNMRNRCLVKVYGYNAAGSLVWTDVSDARFSIEVLKVTWPNGGEVLRGATIYTVTWQTWGLPAPVGSFVLAYTTDGGATWKTAGSGVGNPGTRDWKTPLFTVPKPSCRVRITLKDAVGTVLATDESDGYFSIVP